MTRLRTIKDLKLDTKNANKGTERGRKLIAESLARYGAGRSILVDRNGRVIAGNKTIEALAKNGHRIRVVETNGKELVVVQRTDLDLDSKKARELAIADNRTSELDLEWDHAILQELDVDLSKFWNESELRSLVPQEEISTPVPQLDKAEPLRKKWKTARGQLWEIAKHRLMCGDSTSESDVSRLMGKRHAVLICTDPPYGIDYLNIIKSRSASKKSRFSPMENDTGTGEQLQAFLEKAFRAALPHLSENAAWYLWHAQMTQGFFAAAAAAAADILIHRQIVWVKPSLILGHGDYHWRHELCFYGWRKGHKARWFGDRSQTTVWEIDNERSELHPTAKPSELFRRPMIFNTEAGEICYEPFAGTATQFCAAEQTKRICYGLEIEPKYVAVALERLSEMGLKPKLLSK